MKNILYLFVFSITTFAATAQDTMKRKTIDITSTFKPVLREPSKVNFNAAPLVADTTRPALQYNIPAENLLFAYQPVDLKPVSLAKDSAPNWPYSNFIKLGVGNIHQPYLKAGFTFGDGENKFFNVFGDYYNSKGNKPFQKNSMARVGATMTYRTPANLEWNAGLGFSSDDYYFYGFQPDTLKFTKDQLRQRFSTLEGRVSLRNLKPTEFGLLYNPSVKASLFTDNHDPRTNEVNSVFNVPVQRNFSPTTAFKLGLTADLTSYHHGDLVRNNNVFMVSPTLLLNLSNVYIHGGIIPSWENKNFHMLPNIMADITTADKRFTVQLGWIGYYDKGSYMRYTSINPWLVIPRDSVLRTTRVQEAYAGFKGSAGNHFSYSAKLGYQRHFDMPLFVNDAGDGKTFNTIYVNLLEVVQVHAEAEYRTGEKFSAKAVFNSNFYTVTPLPRAWGLIPLELRTTVRYEILRDLFLKADLWAFDSPAYPGLNGSIHKNDPAIDLNLGAELKITKNFNVWLQMNNIFNDEYQRWNQYPVFGFNILGGLVYSFNQ